MLTLCPSPLLALGAASLGAAAFLEVEREACLLAAVAVVDILIVLFEMVIENNDLEFYNFKFIDRF